MLATTVAAPAASAALDTPLIVQKMSHWCWAWSTAMVLGTTELRKQQHPPAAWSQKELVGKIYYSLCAPLLGNLAASGCDLNGDPALRALDLDAVVSPDGVAPTRLNPLAPPSSWILEPLPVLPLNQIRSGSDKWGVHSNVLCPSP